MKNGKKISTIPLALPFCFRALVCSRNWCASAKKKTFQMKNKLYSQIKSRAKQKFTVSFGSHQRLQTSEVATAEHSLYPFLPFSLHSLFQWLYQQREKKWYESGRETASTCCDWQREWRGKNSEIHKTRILIHTAHTCTVKRDFQVIVVAVFFIRLYSFFLVPLNMYDIPFTDLWFFVFFPLVRSQRCVCMLLAVSVLDMFFIYKNKKKHTYTIE